MIERTTEKYIITGLCYINCIFKKKRNSSSLVTILKQNLIHAYIQTLQKQNKTKTKKNQRPPPKKKENPTKNEKQKKKTQESGNKRKRDMGKM